MDTGTMNIKPAEAADRRRRNTMGGNEEAASGIGKAVENRGKAAAGRRYALTLALSLLALLPFLSRLIWRSISIDTEQMICTPQRILTSWLYHERPGLVVSKYLFGQTVFHYNTEIIGTAVFLAAACGAWAGFVRRAAGKKTGALFAVLFPILFLTHPVLTEQFHFLLQSMEVAWAVLLCLTAAGLVSEWLQGQRRLWALPAGIVAMAWSFGSYQSLTALYVAAAAGLFLLYYESVSRGEAPCVEESRQGGAGKECTALFWWRTAVLHVVVFAAGFLLSRAAAKAGLYLSTGSTQSTAYVAGMVRWGSRPAVECLRELYHYGKQILSGQGPYGSPAWITAAVGTALVLAARFLRDRRAAKGRKAAKGRPAGWTVYLLAGTILYLSPFLLPLYLGGADQVRARMAMPFVIAFGWCYLICLAGGAPGKRDKGAEDFCAVGLGLLAAACLFGLVQVRQTVRLTRTAYEVYRQECALSEELIRAIRETGAPDDAAVQLVGRWSPEPSGGLVRGETTGNSFFEWDAEKAYGSTERVVGLWNTLGYEYRPVELQTAESGCEAAAGMPCWPEAGAVVWDGERVLIKLSP